MRVFLCYILKNIKGVASRRGFISNWTKNYAKRLIYPLLCAAKPNHPIELRPKTARGLAQINRTKQVVYSRFVIY